MHGPLRIAVIVWLLLLSTGMVSSAAAQRAKEPSGTANHPYQQSLPPAGMAAGQPVPDNFVHLDTDPQEKNHVIIVDKAAQEVLVYAGNGQWRLIRRFPCSTGENKGPKQSDGDKKTPEGIYFCTHHYARKDLTPIYGNHAFPLDYPNALDRQAGKGGDAIWIHGTNKTLQTRDSNGCVVLADDDIEQLAL